MSTITIRWQRLVDAGATCPRCADTGDGVREAADLLTTALSALGVRVRLDEVVIDPADFAAAPLASNLIVINGRSLEDWLGGTSGQSECCDVCGPNDCRTVEVDGSSYEAIPATLVVRAGLLAASEALGEPEPATPTSRLLTLTDANACC